MYNNHNTKQLTNPSKYKKGTLQNAYIMYSNKMLVKINIRIGDNNNIFCLTDIKFK